VNIIVTKFYTVEDHTKWYGDRSSEADLEQNYSEMIEVMKDSAVQCVEDLDDIIVHTGTVSDIRTAFEKHYW
jgi:phosphatidate phosphatase APP1